MPQTARNIHHKQLSNNHEKLKKSKPVLKTRGKGFSKRKLFAAAK
jgi:hypothetical protein